MEEVEKENAEEWEPTLAWRKELPEEEIKDMAKKCHVCDEDDYYNTDFLRILDLVYEAGRRSVCREVIDFANEKGNI